ncbi:porin family protein [Siphonobacter sp.]|uniref:type IX secretion/gliding motility protein PorT/SprT n=1 Tax=Siphonobacter sp. TaxID=1869184 RepID=UPI003B3B5E46
MAIAFRAIKVQTSADRVSGSSSFQRSTLPGLIFIFMVLGIPAVKAQNTIYQRKHLEFYDDKSVHYGFFFGLPNTRFQVKHSDQYNTQDSVRSMHSPNSMGFRMGFLMNVYLSPRLDFRFSPLTLSIYSRPVDVTYTNGTEQRLTRESTWIEFPFMLKYKSERRGNTRMYAVAGFRAGLEANVRRKQNINRGVGQLATRSADFSVEYGVGLERFFEYFKFTPELHFSHGIANLIQPTNSISNRGISRLTSHTVTIYLMFE